MTAHFKTFNERDEKLEDSETYKLGLPMSFLIGYYQVPKCWEIALVSLRAGEKVRMRCPAHYAYGGAEKYSHFGSVKIPAWSELIFELSVLECEESPEALDSANKKHHTGATPLMKKNIAGTIPSGTSEDTEDTSDAAADDAVLEEEAEVDKLKETVEA